jgi:hypothetical protein
MAGLLDSMFNPQTYGGQGGGLLDLLKQFQTQQQYQPSAGFGEQLTPQNAQPTQGQMPGPPTQIAPQAAPQMAAQEEPNRFMTGLQGFIGNLHNGPIGALAGGIGALATGQRTDPGGIAQQHANQTEQALVSKGLDPALARTVARNPELLKAVLPQVFGIGGQTDDIKEYERAKKDPEFAKYMESKRAGAGEVGLNPVWGEDAKGNPVLGQLNKRAEFMPTKLPPGVTPSKGVDKIDLGTEWGVVSKVNGQLVGRYPKDIVGKESAEERGKIQGQAQGELPAVELAAKRSISKIDEFLTDKGFNEVFGALDQFRPNFTMSDDGRRALTRFNQMEGTAFLEGRSMLKGGGAITDFESKKAEAAFARLSRSLSESDARDALKDFKDAVQAGLEKLRAKARGGSAPASAPSAVTSGLPDGWSVKVN